MATRRIKRTKAVAGGATKQRRRTGNTNAANAMNVTNEQSGAPLRGERATAGGELFSDEETGRASGNGRYVRTQREVSDHFDVALRTVGYWVAEGMPGVEGRYDLAEIERWRSERFPGKTGAAGAGAPPDDDRRASLYWSTQFRKVQTALKSLELKVQQKKLIPAEEVERGRVARIMAVKQAFLALPREVAPQLVGLEPGEIQTVLEDRVKQIIEGFARGGINHGLARISTD